MTLNLYIMQLPKDELTELLVTCFSVLAVMLYSVIK